MPPYVFNSIKHWKASKPLQKTTFSTVAIWRYPCCVATCNGVRPSSLRWFFSTPASSKTFRIRAWPSWAARCKRLPPFLGGLVFLIHFTWLKHVKTFKNHIYQANMHDFFPKISTTKTISKISKQNTPTNTLTSKPRLCFLRLGL